MAKLRMIIPNFGNQPDGSFGIDVGLLEGSRAGSLSAAARQQGMPIATVSRKITELESHLRTKLFDRSSRKLVLTDAGNSYVVACKRILADLMEAEHAASGEYTAPTGELTVAAPAGLGRIYVIPILADFLEAYPNIDVRLILLLQQTHHPVGEDQQVDVAIRIGELPDSSLIAMRLGAIRRVVCASPAYLAARGTPLTPDGLSGHDCISYAGFMSPDLWPFVSDNTNTAIPVHSQLIVSSVEAACDAACAGIGIPDFCFFVPHPGGSGARNAYDLAG